MAQRRLLAWVPQWALLTAGAEYPPDTPVVLATSRRILDASLAARERGVTPHMALAHARALVPDIVVLSPDPDRAERAFGAVMEALETLRHDVAHWRPGIAVCPLGRWTSPDDEQRLIGEATQRIAAVSGADARVGIADGTLGALFAAYRGAVVAPDGQGALLAPVPLSWVSIVVDPGPARAACHDFLSTLRALGLETCGDVAALDPGVLAARYGALGHLVDTLARGGDWIIEGTPAPERDHETWAEYDPPLVGIDAALFAAKNLADTLLSSLKSAQLHPTRIRTAVLAGEEEHARTWMLDPHASSGDVVHRFRWHLARWMAGDDNQPVRALGVSATATIEASQAAATLWGEDPLAATTRRAHEGVCRLTDLLGPGRILRPSLQPGFDPRTRSSVTIWDYLAPPARGSGEWRGAIEGKQLALLYDSPLKAGLHTVDGRSVAVGETGLLDDEPATCSLRFGQVEAVGSYRGPFLVSGTWWAPDASGARAYLEVELSSGRHLLVWRDRAWWHEGTYATPAR